jgi:peptide/nickel transport system permease protein
MALSSTSEKAIEVVTVGKRRGAFADFFVRLVREMPLGTLGGVITLIFLVTAIFTGFLAPYGMNETGVAPTLTPPSMDYPLGSDQLGRDVLSRIIYGARVSVIVGLAATTLATFISTLIGLLSGYIGGWFDLLFQRIVDGWMSFPGLVLLIVAVTLVGPGMWQVIILLGFLFGIGGSRIVRGAVIGIKENLYVGAARAIGCTTPRMLTHHILPNIMAPVIILYTTRVPTMILVEASLSFLGLGIPPPEPSWGGMLSMEGRRFMFESPWLAIWPGLALSIVVYGVNMFGDALRDLLDPRLRGGVGRYSGTSKRRKKR